MKDTIIDIYKSMLYFKEKVEYVIQNDDSFTIKLTCSCSTVCKGKKYILRPT